MEYRNNNQKDTKRNSVNTRGIQFMNSSNELVKSTMVIGWWDSFMTINIHPALDKNEQRPDRMFNYTVNVSAAISPERMRVLAEIDRDYIQPALEEKKECIASFMTSNTTLLSLGVKNIDGVFSPFLKISKNLNEKRIPEIELIYVFNGKQPIILNYDSETGGFDSTEILHTEYNFFISILNPCSSDLMGAAGHGERYNRRFANTRMDNIIKEMAKKLGVSIEPNNGYNYNGRQNPFSSNTSSNDSTVNGDELEVTEGLDEVPF